MAEVFEQAYEPMVGALERHPSVQLGLHYTGPLLEWLRAERPSFLDRLAELVAREQVELLGGGYDEPVLISLPERDRIGQLRRLADEVEVRFGRRPTGAWLAERVWEPSLPTALASAGYGWTILDDAHFRAAGVPESALWGPYTTEDQGQLVRVFGTERGLRYLIPFREVDEVIDHLRAHATPEGDRLGTMGDDGEKFGAWPTTWEHCWGRGRWVERFFDALEANAEWLSTTTPSGWLALHPPIGRVYVPSSSYFEMGEWALPPDEARDFAHAAEEARAAGRPEARWLRGAPWRNFQVRYREVNDLHKQMLRTSEKVAAMPDGPAREVAVRHLYRGQSNDCYWHGVFGGVYISHMRVDTFGQLIAAEDLADGAAGAHTSSALVDVDLDGRDEVFLATPGQVVTVELDEGAGIGSWDVRAVRHPVTAVLRRRPEVYHETLRESEAAEARAGDARATEATASERPAAERMTIDGGASVESIHEIVRGKERGLARHLVYDAWERRSGLVRFLDPTAPLAEAAAGLAPELGDFVAGPFRLVELGDGRVRADRDGVVRVAGRSHPVHVDKALTLGGDRRSPTLTLEVLVGNRADVPLDTVLGLEWSTMMLGGGANPAAWWLVEGERRSHDSRGELPRVANLAQGNDAIGVAVVTGVEPPAAAAWAPIETISKSESGFERVYQGSSLVLAWPVHLEPGELRAVTVRQEIATIVDRAAEGAGAA